uniref:Myomesin 3 n=2 Tax=Salarias fasciatus TaxID=181472 RepID=A0A672HCA0_SALFA
HPFLFYFILFTNVLSVLQAEKKASEYIEYLDLLSQKAPDFPIPLRAHTVWEGMTVKLCCTVQGCPPPKVMWYKDGRPLIMSAQPWNYSLQQKFGLNILEIRRWVTASAPCEWLECFDLWAKKKKKLKKLQRESLWISSLLPPDASAAVLGGPASPLAVQVADINKDYVFLIWQPPSADGSSPVEGYIIERCDLGLGEWERCNVNIQKMCYYPVSGLKEGTRYQFRVRAVNKAGAGRPSKATEPIVTADPLEPSRTMGRTLPQSALVHGGRTITVQKDDLEGQVKVPFPPTDVHACEVSDTYVVLSWTEPDPRGREPLTFYVERTPAGQSSWELASLDMAVNSPRFPVFDLVKGKQYCFRVRSVNKYGVSDPSEPSPPISLGKPQELPAPPHSVMAYRDTNTSVLLQWQEPADKDDILGYYLYASEVGSQDWKTVNNKPVTKNRFTVHGLKTGKEYVFRVKSVSRAGNSVYSEESEPILVRRAIHVPSAPSAIALLLCTGSEMVLGWRAPSDNGGSRIRGYYLDQREDVRDFKILVRVLFLEDFLCEKWTMPEPGCPYDLECREVRDDSLVLLWAAPLYEGRGPVTGYFLEVSQGDQSEEWTTLNDKPITDTRYKVSGLETGQTFRFRVAAVNEAGVGCPSLPTEPITVQTQPGTKEIEIGVDDDGFIFLGYEATEMNDDSEFLWGKNYTDPIDPERAQEKTKDNKSVLTFTDPSEEDLGLYTVEMSDNPQLSSSYDFTAEGELDAEILIELKSGWHVEVSETGGVRLWLQTESLSDDAELRLIFNDHEISSSPHRKINFDRAKGLVEILFDQLTPEDEGSYTAQLKDGRAKNQFTLVFVDKSGSFRHLLHRSYLFVSDFKFQNSSCILYVCAHSPSREKQIDKEARTKPGSSKQQVWIDISDPTENDKGKYTLEMFDGGEKHKRFLDLSGQERARVIKGLPDVVAIMEGKSLCLTCFIDGDPAPESCWLRNDKEIFNQDQFTITKEPKCSAITINNVNMQDSGKYSIFVHNQYGSDTADVTVSVYKRGEKPPANAVHMGF